ncbi:DMT family transporter [Alteromonas gilva]|uniref:EamA family transporter n=1 Tax=Alteromonas gilva TaxID=2987522 RepID=A0ABT5L4M8_9ALTE|nr:EamA family transporter [Alteromonas gilva]MDC8832008.1 EamA family transporter [Alteromonas gilva]
MSRGFTGQRSYILGIFSVVTAAILWGTTGTAATFAPQVSPLAIAAVSMGVGGLLQALMAWRHIQRSGDALRRSKTLLLIGAINVAVYPLAFYSAMRLSGVAVGNVVSIGMAPIAATLIEKCIDRQPITGRWLLSMIVGVTGVICLLNAKPTGAFSDASVDWNNLLGVFLGLVAAFTYAMYTWVAHRLISSGISSQATMGSMFGGGGILLMPVLLITGAPLLHTTVNSGVGLYMAVVPMFLGYFLFGKGLAQIRASLATTITLLEPVVATLLAVIIVGEQLSLAGWLGVGLIGICLVIATVRKPIRSNA